MHAGLERMLRAPFKAAMDLVTLAFRKNEAPGVSASTNLLGSGEGRSEWQRKQF